MTGSSLLRARHESVEITKHIKLQLHLGWFWLILGRVGPRGP